MSNELILPDEISVDCWNGATRHQFRLSGCTAWIVVPDKPAKGKLWFWIPEWPEAYPERNGARDLLKLGYTMAHINVRGKCGSPEAVEIMKSLYDFMQGLGYARKAAMIGMSLGGLYSFRYSAAYPETVACIYADAPVCDLYYRNRSRRADATEISQAYGLGDNTESLKDHPLSPINNYMPIVKAGIPLLLLLGATDTVVPPEHNGRLLAERWKAAGGMIEVLERGSWGHHPHGLDDTSMILRFILENTMNLF